MKRLIGIALALIMLCLGLVALPAAAAESSDDPAWTIFFRPSMRFGTDERMLFTLDFIVPLYDGEKNLLFFNPRHTRSLGGGWETNLGLGYRHLLFDDKLILGANAYYDMRRTSWGSYHHQVGFGLEAMTELNKYVALTGRFNYYIPLTDPIITGGGAGGGYIFRDEGIYTLGIGTVEESLEGFDGELGVRIPFVSDYVETWVYGGGYHYHGKHVGSVDGWTARVEVTPVDFIRMNYEYRNDNVNRGEHFGELMLEVPFSIGNLVAGKNPFEGFVDNLSGSRSMKERLNEPVRRDVDITVKREVTGGSGTEGELVEGVIFVSDDGSDATGDGTYENPYATIDNAVNNLGAYNIVHVMNRIGGTIGGGTVDVSGATIWGSGVAHPDYPVISNFTAGAYPTITSVINVDASASNVTLMGLRVVTDTGYCMNIYNGIGTVIRDNILTTLGGGDDDGARVLNCYLSGGGSETAPLIIDHNTITNTLGGRQIGAIGLSWSSNDIFARITNNTLEADGYSCSFGILAQSNGNIGSTANPLVISGNTITTTAPRAWGIYLTSPEGGGAYRTFAEITGNEIHVNYITGSPHIPLIAPNAAIWMGNRYAVTGNFGTLADPIVIANNRGTISPNPNGQYFLYLVTGTPGGGNAVNWGGIGTGTGQNNFTPTGSWGGFEGQNSPVFNQNLLDGAGDDINPNP